MHTISAVENASTATLYYFRALPTNSLSYLLQDKNHLFFNATKLISVKFTEIQFNYSLNFTEKNLTIFSSETWHKHIIPYFVRACQAFFSPVFVYGSYFLNKLP